MLVLESSPKAQRHKRAKGSWIRSKSSQRFDRVPSVRCGTVTARQRTRVRLRITNRLVHDISSSDHPDGQCGARKVPEVRLSQIRLLSGHQWTLRLPPDCLISCLLGVSLCAAVDEQLSNWHTKRKCESLLRDPGAVIRNITPLSPCTPPPRARPFLGSLETN